MRLWVLCDKFSRSFPRRSLTRDDPSAFAAPSHFGPFRVLHQIGVGALGPVFRTYEPERDRLVAVKVFRLDITPEQARALADELSRSAEAGLFHPSIVEPIAAGVEGTVAYCAEEYVAAESLDVAMRQYAPAPIATVLPFITQMAGALDFARAAGVGHGALHPRDVFVTPEEARLTGFGVVEALERVGLRAPVRRPYSPPERISGGGWNTTADVFSLAAITYELMTGRRPAGLGAEIGSLSAGTPSPWSDTLHAVLTRAMDAEPENRYPTALAFASALEAATRGELIEQPRPARAAEGLLPPAAAVIAAAAPLVAQPGSEPGRPEEEDDILGEREEDEIDHRLRAEPVAAPFTRDRDLELDRDIEAEMEADRFVADDFLLGAAGAASAGPAPSSLDVLRGSQMPLTASGDIRQPVDRRALEDDEVMIDEAPPAIFAPTDLLHQERAQPQRMPQTVHGASPAFGSSASDDRPQRRSSAVRLLPYVAALAIGLGGGWAIWGRSPESTAGTGGAGTTAIAHPGRTDQASGSPGAAPVAGPAASREFSDHALTAPPQTAPGSSGAGPAQRSAPVTEGGNAAAAPAAARPPAAAPAAAAPTGTLVIRSTPSGAGVTVNGRWRGRTPLTVDDLPLRRYTVRLVRPGFQAATETVSLTGQTPRRSLSLRLRPAARAAAPGPATVPPRENGATVYTGTVFVDSRPRGARVSIDGRAVGVTPVLVPDVRVGTHIVRLELPDHRIWSAPTTVVAGEEKRVTGSLERIQ